MNEPYDCNIAAICKYIDTLLCSVVVVCVCVCVRSPPARAHVVHRPAEQRTRGPEESLRQLLCRYLVRAGPL